ncbi:hypothetical protein IWX48DRAFT_401856 [Phyllosticta citricarpa]
MIFAQHLLYCLVLSNSSNLYQQCSGISSMAMERPTVLRVEHLDDLIVSRGKRRHGSEADRRRPSSHNLNSIQLANQRTTAAQNGYCKSWRGRIYIYIGGIAK